MATTEIKSMIFASLQHTATRTIQMTGYSVKTAYSTLFTILYYIILSIYLQ